MKDLLYLTTAPPLTLTCDGVTAIGQRVLALLFAEPDNLRSVGGSGFDVLRGSSDSGEAIKQFLQIGLTDVLVLINFYAPSMVTAAITGVSKEKDKIRVTLSVTMKKETVEVSVSI